MKNYGARLSRLERGLSLIGGLGPSRAEYAAARDELGEHVRLKISALVEGLPAPPQPTRARETIQAYNKANHIPEDETARDRLLAKINTLASRSASGELS